MPQSIVDNVRMTQGKNQKYEVNPKLLRENTAASATPQDQSGELLVFGEAKTRE